MRVLFVAPCERPVLRDILPNDEAIKKAIGDGCKKLNRHHPPGLTSTVAIIEDAEGTKKLLPPNRKPVGVPHTIVGNFVVAATGYKDLDEKQIEFYKRLLT